jgi:hypothetical protein
MLPRKQNRFAKGQHQMRNRSKSGYCRCNSPSPDKVLKTKGPGGNKNAAAEDANYREN